jgi:hypothetical protein
VFQLGLKLDALLRMGATRGRHTELDALRDANCYTMQMLDA